VTGLYETGSSYKPECALASDAAQLPPSSPSNHNTTQSYPQGYVRATIVDAASLRLELMQQNGVAFAVQAYRHSTDRTVDDIALEGDTLALEVGHETIEVLDLECDRAAGVVTGLFLGEVGKGQAAAAGQVVFHPPVVPLVAGRARLEAERLLVELARPRHVCDWVIREGDFLEHGNLSWPRAQQHRADGIILFHLRAGTLTRSEAVVTVRMRSQ
jgi:hypothetical protein